jgi:hypothetical protein
MNVQKPSLYIAALVMGCMAWSAPASAQVRVIAEVQGSAGSSGATTRPVFVESTIPGGSGTGTTRPIYVDAVAPGGSGTSVTRPVIVIGATPTPTPDQVTPFQFGIYPNPARDFFYVEWSNASGQKVLDVRLYTDRGQLATVPYERSGDSFRVQVINIPRGRYYVELVTERETFRQAIEII